MNMMHYNEIQKIGERKNINVCIGLFLFHVEERLFVVETWGILLLTIIYYGYLVKVKHRDKKEVENDTQSDSFVIPQPIAISRSTFLWLSSKYE